MTAAALSTNRVRITARVPPAVQQKLKQAASLTGTTLNQFVIQTALREAERVIVEENVTRLSGRGMAAFLSALDHPLPPNAKLQAALQNHTARRHDQTGTLDWVPR